MPFRPAKGGTEITKIRVKGRLYVNRTRSLMVWSAEAHLADLTVHDGAGAEQPTSTPATFRLGTRCDLIKRSAFPVFVSTPYSVIESIVHPALVQPPPPKSLSARAERKTEE